MFDEEQHITIVQSIIAYTSQFSDDPETIAELIADAATMVIGIEEIDLLPIMERMKRTYLRTLKESAIIDGFSDTMN